MASASRRWLMETIMPRPKPFEMTSVTGMFIASARSPVEMNSMTRRTEACSIIS